MPSIGSATPGVPLGAVPELQRVVFAKLAIELENQVRTSVTVVMVEPEVTTTAIGRSPAVNAVVFTAGAQLADEFKYT
jgi:hypothetical protein